MKHKFLATILFIIAFAMCSITAQAQSGGGASKISSKCPNPSKLFANITILTIGDIQYVPCPTRYSLFYGNVDFSNATVTGLPGGTVTGTGTANHMTRFTAASVIGDTPATWNNLLYNWTNTGATATFDMSFTPDSANGLFTLGSSQTKFSLDQNAKTAAFLVPDAGGIFAVQNATLSDSGISYAGTGKTITLKTAAAGSVLIGDSAAAGTGALFSVIPSASSGLFQYTVTSGQGTIAYSGIGQFQYQRTITPGGTVGAQTINKPVGTVNFAAGASTLVVTSVDALVNSIIFVTARRADATCFPVAATPAAGSFTITMSAPCTAETSVGFFITN